MFLGAVEPAGGAALDEAARCLDEQQRTEGRRAALLRQADSLGLRIETARARGDRAPQDLLRRADRLGREAQDLEVELVLRRAACREFAMAALTECESRIAQLRVSPVAATEDTTAAEELLRLRALRSRLQGWLAGPVLLGYPLIPPDSTDTPETLGEKLRYHQNVMAGLRELAGRVRARRAEVAEERRSLEEAGRFLEDLSFLSEGGRVSPSGTVRLPAVTGATGTTGETGRSGSGSESGGATADLGWILAASPGTPEESDRILRLLDEYLQAIEKEIRVVGQA